MYIILLGTSYLVVAGSMHYLESYSYTYTLDSYARNKDYITIGDHMFLASYAYNKQLHI